MQGCIVVLVVCTYLYVVSWCSCWGRGHPGRIRDLLVLVLVLLVVVVAVLRNYLEISILFDMKKNGLA